MVKADKIILEAKRLIGTPFCHFGRSSLGLDCSGLIWLSHNRCGIEFPKLDRPYKATWWMDMSQGERLLDGLIDCWNFKLVDKPVIGGLILFRIFGKKVPINHCAILIEEDRFVHSKCGIGKRINKTSIDKLYGTLYEKKTAGFLIHPEVDYGDYI